VNSLIGIGIDMVAIRRLEGVLARRPGLCERLFSEEERAYTGRLSNPVPALAARFAAKEAAMKALGVGLGAVRFTELEVRRSPSGAPTLKLCGCQAGGEGLAGVAKPHRGHRVCSGGRPVMIPVLYPEEMAEVDRSAPDPVEVLISRAGMAAALAARRLLGGCYGKRVLTVAGPGNNGSDGRSASALLRRWGASVAVVDPSPAMVLPAADLVIDAAYGTGLKRAYQPPDPGSAPVLAVDIPSGLSGSTGEGDSMRARCTVTFGSYKPGLLQGEGPDRAGRVELAPIGLGELARERARCWLIEDPDVARTWQRRPRRAHKWQSAVAVIGGSPAMRGAPLLAALAALRAGAGYALVGTPGVEVPDLPPGEQVGFGLPAEGWEREAMLRCERARALVVGPGLGPAADREAIIRFLGGTLVPAVIDADALTALGSWDGVAAAAKGRAAALVLTPHEGEFARLAGRPPGSDRIREVKEAASRSGAVVLLKGSPTVVGDPSGTVCIVRSGSSRLATAGTGDVLSGAIAAFLARGIPALEAAGLAAHVHGRAGGLGAAEGLVASDLPELISRWLSEAVKPEGARG
jgi:holo-[acyl-carrier-protein] synthase